MKWNGTFDVRAQIEALLAEVGNDELSPIAKALVKNIAARMRVLFPGADEVMRIAHRLEQANTASQFDEAWSDFYDWADKERIWVPPCDV